MPQTYIEKVKELKMDSNKIYEWCGALRDMGTEIEKEEYNKLRGLLGEVWTTFQKLERHIHRADRADMEI